MQINISESWKRLRRKAKKMKWSSMVSIVLLLLMLGSTVTGFVLQALSSGTDEIKDQVEIPAGNIVNYELTVDQRNELMRRGMTLVEYRYQYVCENCDIHRGFLASAISEYPEQIFVQEILDDTLEKPVLEMSSLMRREILTDPSSDDIMAALCDVMVDPPVRCVTSLR